MTYYNHSIKVFYRDVDKMGIVYYSRYFEYFEEGRTEMLKSIGIKAVLIGEVLMKQPNLNQAFKKLTDSK